MGIHSLHLSHKTSHKSARYSFEIVWTERNIKKKYLKKTFLDLWAFFQFHDLLQRASIFAFDSVILIFGGFKKLQEVDKIIEFFSSFKIYVTLRKNFLQKFHNLKDFKQNNKKVLHRCTLSNLFFSLNQSLGQSSLKVAMSV